MLAGIDTNVLIDFLVLDARSTLARVLEGEGWTTAFVNEEFFDPRDDKDLDIPDVFPFVEVDPVDARLLPRIQRDQLAIAGASRAASGGAAGETSLVHVTLNSRPGSIILSNDSHAVGLGSRRGVTVRGTLYVLHQAVTANILILDEAWRLYQNLLEKERRPPNLTRAQLESHLTTGTDPR